MPDDTPRPSAPDEMEREARDLSYFIAASRFGEGAARNAFAEDIRNCVLETLRRVDAAARASGIARGREEAAQLADQEEVPEVGGMPPELIKAVLAQDTVTIERALIACVTATKRSIADAIRGLPVLPLDHKEKPDAQPEPLSP